jgi:glyoxylase-like metal-dependent hydrolase (beta-lactamase superfamily II)
LIVVGSNEALVFDGGGFVAQGEQVLAKVKSVTDKPLKYVVISHWHGDHHRGIAPLVDAYPGVQIVSHTFTRDAILGAPMQRIHKGELEGGAADTAAAIQKSLEKDQFIDGSPLDPQERPFFEQFVTDNKEHAVELKRMRLFTPTMTFDDRLEIDLGSRTVDLLHFGPANTKGDVILHLPALHIVASGDVVVHPVPYGFGSYPRDWANALRQIKALNYSLLIPGHGEIQRDHAYLDLLTETLEGVATQVGALIARRVDRKAGERQVDFNAVEQRFTNGNPVRKRLFDIFFKQPIVSAAWNVATGIENEKLTDDPPAKKAD